MIKDEVTVFLNGKLVVDNVILENYWSRQEPIFPTGQLELQSHGWPSYWKNIYVKELPEDATLSAVLGKAQPQATPPAAEPDHTENSPNTTSTESASSTTASSAPTTTSTTN